MYTIGPVVIVEKVNANAYRLKLPSHIHFSDVLVEHLLPYYDNSSDDAFVVNLRANFTYLEGNDASPNVEQRAILYLEVYLYYINVPSKYDKLETKFFEERAALEAKYQKLYAPLYLKRHDIVNSVVEVDGNVDETAIDVRDDTAKEDKGAPSFWLDAMKTFFNHVHYYQISERDEEILKYLKDIKWCPIDIHKSFKLEFFFDTNPFFENSILTKVYHMADYDENLLKKAIGTEIKWLPEECLSQTILKKKPPKDGSENAKPIAKTEDCKSFFNFFNPVQMLEDEDDIDEEMFKRLINQLEKDYSIGSTFRDKIIPHAVSWFTGEAFADEFGSIEDFGF
uniref:nucleosome assembly protein 1;2-like n=1 Tax=Erigeron canadensis TaxID=72917 RepID=UPI001CB88F28|nr:nucleosome assembly protein 1;2-like [Erigeron canadensis]